MKPHCPISPIFLLNALPSSASQQSSGEPYHSKQSQPSPLASDRSLTPYKTLTNQSLGVGSLSLSTAGAFTPVRDPAKVLSQRWTKGLNDQIEGVSDMEEEQPGSYISQQDKNIRQRVRLEVKVIKKKREGCEERSSCSVEQKTVRNETKNIPKNFGKAIIIFIERNKAMLEPVMLEFGYNFDTILEGLKAIKKKVNTIADLRGMWEESQQGKCIRVISNYFLRKHSLHYIYNSRIKTSICHSKYRRRLQEALANPEDFKHIKEY